MVSTGTVSNLQESEPFSYEHSDLPMETLAMLNEESNNEAVFSDISEQIQSLNNPHYTDSLSSNGSDVPLLGSLKLCPEEKEESSKKMDCDRNLYNILDASVYQNDLHVMGEEHFQVREKLFMEQEDPIEDKMEHGRNLYSFLDSSSYISNLDCSSKEHSQLSETCQKLLVTMSGSSLKLSLMQLPCSKDQIEEFDKKVWSEPLNSLITNHWKNLIALSLSFMVLFMAFATLRHLQSSLNHEAGIGLITLSCLYAAFFVGSFLAPYLVKKLRPKRAIIISLIFHLFYVFGNVYPKIYILLPASVLVGIWTAVLWSAQGTYVQLLAQDYAKKTNAQNEHILSKFHGIFFLIMFSSEVFGNLISSLVLGSNESNVSGTGADNSTTEVALSQSNHSNHYHLCGAQYCHFYETGQETIDLSNKTKFTLFGVFAGLELLAVGIVFVFVDSLRNYSTKNNSKGFQQVVSDVKSVASLMLDWRFLLLTPIFMFSSMHIAYISGEITKAYVTCMLGIHMVGYMMICYGIFDAVSSYLTGMLNRFVGRVTLILAGSVFLEALVITLLLWEPVPGNLIPYLLIFGVWGFSDGFYASQLNVLTGTLFNGNCEAAFSAFRMMQSVGMTIAYAYASSLCLSIKLYILGSFGLVGSLLYLHLELRLKQTENKTLQEVVRDQNKV